MFSRWLPSLAWLLFGLLPTGCKKAGESAEPERGSAQRNVRIGIVADLGAAPIVVAQAHGFFKKHGITASLQVLDSTESVARELATGALEGGMLTPAEALAPRESSTFVIPCVLARNAGGIAVNKALWEAMQPDLLRELGGQAVQPIHADALRLVSQRAHVGGEPIHFQIRSPRATSAFTLRYWLEAAGVGSDAVGEDQPGSRKAQVEITTAPAPERSLGGHAGSLWELPEAEITVITNEEIVRDLPSAVFSHRADWINANEETAILTVAALIEAGQWLDANRENRRMASGEIAQVIAPEAGPPLLTNIQERVLDSTSGVTFGENGSAAPDQPSALWILSQMARWGQLPLSLSDADFANLAETSLRPDLFLEAVKRTGMRLPGLRMRLDRAAPIDHVIDGNRFQPRRTTAYLGAFKIGGQRD